MHLMNIHSCFLNIIYWLLRRSLFDPPLPPAKVEAIERIGFGRAGKVFMEFDAPFWSEGEEVIKIAWGKQV